MKEITITINESNITKRIYVQSGYSALARMKAGLSERFGEILQATEDEQKILTGYINDSIYESAEIINRYLPSCSAKPMESNENSDRVIYIILTLPQNCPTSIATTLKDCITSFAVSRALQYWTMTVKPDEANIHLAKAQTELTRMREILSKRERPVIEKYEKENIIEL